MEAHEQFQRIWYPPWVFFSSVWECYGGQQPLGFFDIIGFVFMQW